MNRSPYLICNTTKSVAKRISHSFACDTMLVNNTTVDRTGLSSQVRLLEGFGLSFVLLVSVMLNLAVCAIIWRTKVLRNKATNTFVANLCIANLLLTACVIPFSLVTIVRDEHAAYSRLLCQVRPNLYNCVLKISKFRSHNSFATLGCNFTSAVSLHSYKKM